MNTKQTEAVRIFTSADDERKVKAMEKRERKAAKREQEAQMPVDPAAGQSLRAMRFFNRHERAKP